MSMPSHTLVMHLDQARNWMRLLAVLGTAAALFALAYAFGSLFGIVVARNLYDAMFFGPIGASACLPVVLLWQTIESVSSFLASPSEGRLEQVARANSRFWSLAGVLGCVLFLESLLGVYMTVVR